MKTKLLILLVLCCSLSINAQEVFEDFYPGPNGERHLTDTDNEYSAFVLKGPNIPSGEESKRDLVFKFRAAGKSIIRSYRGGNWDTFLQFLTTPYDDYLPKVRMHISDIGNIGIGTITPQYKLDVNGTIRAKEIKVESGWADFVFKKDYKLPTLEEVEQHIIKKGTLPNVPTEDDVKANGMNLSEMNTMLLQKIEELTLYMIELKKENIQIKEQLSGFQNRIN